MKLWVVTRRAPLQRAQKQVRVWRTAAMAPTADEAIALAKGPLPDQSTQEGLMFHIEYFTGTWVAEEIEDGKIDLYARWADPTKEERAERNERVAKADARHAAKVVK